MEHKEALSRPRLARTAYVEPMTCQLLMACYGAALVQPAQDVLVILTSQHEVKMPDTTAYTTTEIFLDKTPELSETEWQVIRDNVRKKLAHDPIAVDELCRWCHVSAIIMQSILFDLELSGYLQRHSGNRVSLTFETL